MQLLESVGRCQILGMKKAGETLNPTQPDSCNLFAEHVRNVEASVRNTYQVTAFASLREEDPAKAAALWKNMSDLCECALDTLRRLKDQYPLCGTPQLYDLTLDYKVQADQRHYQNLQDFECSQMPVPEGLFPKTN